MERNSAGAGLEEAAASGTETQTRTTALKPPPLGTAPRKLWAGVSRQLTSVRLAIGLLIALGALSAFGTFFPRLDLYHSLPFTALLAALGVNIAVCSMRRMTTLLRASRQETDPVDDNVQDHAALRERFERPGTVTEAAELVRQALAGRGLAVSAAERDGRTYLLGQGGRFAPWGPVITHLSFLMILAGAVVGSIFGFAGDVNIPEGSNVNAVRLAGGKVVPLGFEVRCDEFEVSFYPGSQQPSDFRSDLTVLEQGREVLRKSIRVNDPLSYGGLRFYQSSYGQMPPLVVDGRLRRAEYTGLRVSYDPGVGLVYAGGVLLCLGLMLSFLQRQRRIWARVEPLGNRVRLSLAGRTLRHSAALEPEFAGIVESLRPAPAPVPVAAKPNKKRRSRS